MIKPSHPSLKTTSLNLRWKWGVIRFIIWSTFHKICFTLAPSFLGITKLTHGSNISLQGRLRIKGGGHVQLGDNVIISDHADLYTHSNKAIIIIGDNTFLNGSRMSAAQKIEIGANNIIADARIMDTDFHWIHRERMTDTRPAPAVEVKTENNVWVAAGSALMKGVLIEENSVIAFGSVVTSRVLKNEIWGGAPAKKISDLPAPPVL